VQERGLVAPLTRPGGLAYAVAAAVVAADLVTTSIAVGHLHDAQHVWGPFGFALTFNSGFAFSLFSGRAVLVSIVLTVGVVILAAVVGRVRTIPLAVGGGLVLGGAVGNLTERLFGGHSGDVPDFVTLSHWPTFNLADASVTVGVVIVIATIVFGPGRVHPEEPK
jgi:signal peptidase II